MTALLKQQLQQFLTLKFEPKLKDGEPDWYRNVVYPLEFRMATAEELELFNNP